MRSRGKRRALVEARPPAGRGGRAVRGRESVCNDPGETRRALLEARRQPTELDESVTIAEESGVPWLKHDPQPARVAEECAANGRVYNDPDHLTIDLS